MQHLDEGTIHSWLDGALTPDEAARAEAHVKDCQQCQAAVAEARGFIAASSRILTALDNAPRGVIPAATPSRRVQPWVWRVAATVLVVATGTFLVLNERGWERFAASGLDRVNVTFAATESFNRENGNASLEEAVARVEAILARADVTKGYAHSRVPTPFFATAGSGKRCSQAS